MNKNELNKLLTENYEKYDVSELQSYYTRLFDAWESGESEIDPDTDYKCFLRRCEVYDFASKKHEVELNRD